MRKNGFTLIELLAVIVILAIIALIATPIILGIINDAREKANERSVELYASAVRNAVAAYQLTGTSSPKTFDDLDIEYDGEVVCATEELYEDGSFYLDGCKVNNGDKEYSYGTKIGSDKACTLDDKDGDEVASLSDVITCGTESFYVMSNDGSNVTMLAAKNLNLDVTNPIQSDSAGTIAFAITDYWIDDDIGYFINNNTCVYGDYPDADGNQQNLIYPYVSAYETYLKEQVKVSSVSASLIVGEASTLGCKFDGINYWTCGPEVDGMPVLENPAPTWLYSTNYWLGCSNGEPQQIMVIDSSGGYHPWDYSSPYGIRPVIIISVDEI